MRGVVSVFGAALLGAACGGGGGDGTEATGSPTGDPGGDPTGETAAPGTGGATEATSVDPTGGGTVDPTGDGTVDPTAGPTSDPTAGETGEPDALGGPFRRGINFGYRNPAFTDPDMAWLSVEAGCTSARLKLGEGHLTKWGYDIELGDAEQYAALGMSGHVAFLIDPIAAHSTAPGGIEEWELAHWIPKNLYAPVKLGDAINPDNYWAAYVYQTVSTYKDHVDIWEVWNEPDWTDDWQYTQLWATEPPLPQHLPRFNGSIYDYVRMLRVTTEAARLADPDAKIALGGLGYPNFLAALLRYTDNPDGGAVTPEFPETGAAYFDVLNFHYYPLWTPGSSDAGVDGMLALRDEFAAAMAAAGAAPRPFHATEIGAPYQPVADAPSGEAYARNFFVKAMVRAQAEGFLGLDWFTLSDADGDSPFSKMGLYHDVAAVAAKEDATRTPTGVAARTLGTLLHDARYDPAGTAALALPPTARGAAFRLPDDRRALVLWAYASGPDEAAAAMVSVPADGGFLLHAWDHSVTATATPLAPEGGQLALALTADPVILVAE